VPIRNSAPNADHHTDHNPGRFVTPVPAYDINQWRSRISLLERFIPMNNCSRGPLLDSVRDAAHAYLRSWDDDGMDWDGWMAEVEGARAEFAALINADPDDVAVLSSVSQATASVAGALDYGERSHVLASRAEFPTVGQVWLAHERVGAQVNWVDVQDGVVPIDSYREAVTQDTRVVSACHGYYQTGFKQDLDALVDIAHGAGAYLFVDAYQTAGTHPIDVQRTPVDFLTAGNLKYLMGAPGIAFLYVQPEAAERLRPTMTGWFGQQNPFAFKVDELEYADGARRLDSGTPPIWNAYVAKAGMAAIREIGVAEILDWTEHLSALLIEGGDRRGLKRLGPSDPALKTPSTAFLCPGDSHTAESMLRERGVIGSARGPVIRYAPHFYSTADDVERALDALADVYSTLS
jgi:selenocysteine lyase/cysteine desulfurase